MRNADDRAELARREFLKATGSLVVGFSAAETVAAQSTAPARGSVSGPPDDAEIDSYIAVHPNNTVTNNKVGTSADGTATIPNVAGLFIGGGTQHNTVDGNVISGNLWEGVDIFADFLPQPTPTSRRASSAPQRRLGRRVRWRRS